MIIDVSGAAGLAAVEVPLKQPLSSENSIRLKYSHLPDLPLLDAFTGGFTVDEEVFNIPSMSSIQELVDHLDSLVTGTDRVCYVWYNGHEFVLAQTQSLCRPHSPPRSNSPQRWLRPRAIHPASTSPKSVSIATMQWPSGCSTAATMTRSLPRLDATTIYQVRIATI